uniref:Ubiquitin-like domain-containing protein n=1 Tax=Panagrellus redivivus TaxID=6233 RepID=A0A7E4V4L7_PANRE
MADRKAYLLSVSYGDTIVYVFIKCKYGRIRLGVFPDDPIDVLKERLEEASLDNVPAAYQRLYYNGQLLHGSLRFHNVKEDDTIIFVDSRDKLWDLKSVLEKPERKKK